MRLGRTRSTTGPEITGEVSWGRARDFFGFCGGSGNPLLKHLENFLNDFNYLNGREAE
jgi:hypothetical protein